MNLLVEIAKSYGLFLVTWSSRVNCHKGSDALSHYGSQTLPKFGTAAGHIPWMSQCSDKPTLLSAECKVFSCGFRLMMVSPKNKHT